MGMKRAEIASKFDEIVDFAGLAEFIDTPVKRYSSGMNARLGFSIAAHLDPDVLLIDEVLAVGDMAFQQRASSACIDFKRAGRRHRVRLAQPAGGGRPVRAVRVSAVHRPRGGTEPRGDRPLRAGGGRSDHGGGERRGRDLVGGAARQPRAAGGHGGTGRRAHAPRHLQDLRACLGPALRFPRVSVNRFGCSSTTRTSRAASWRSRAWRATSGWWWTSISGRT